MHTNSPHLQEKNPPLRLQRSFGLAHKPACIHWASARHGLFLGLMMASWGHGFPSETRNLLIKLQGSSWLWRWRSPSSWLTFTATCLIINTKYLLHHLEYEKHEKKKLKKLGLALYFLLCFFFCVSLQPPSLFQEKSCAFLNIMYFIWDWSRLNSLPQETAVKSCHLKAWLWVEGNTNLHGSIFFHSN